MKKLLLIMLAPMVITACSSKDKGEEDELPTTPQKVCTLIPKNKPDDGVYKSSMEKQTEGMLTIDSRHCDNSLEMNITSFTSQTFTHYRAYDDGSANIQESTKQTIRDSALGDDTWFGDFSYSEQSSGHDSPTALWSGNSIQETGQIQGVDAVTGKNCETDSKIEDFAKCAGDWALLLVNGQEADDMVNYVESSPWQ
ncbi:hypothetical protein [Vibrio astriarenae]|uniref:hypothetical protein n=1 Tax=Vibrio astriarenae TaxID=1481923 RepID=UPI003735DD00